MIAISPPEFLFPDWVAGILALAIFAASWGWIRKKVPALLFMLYRFFIRGAH